MKKTLILSGIILAGLILRLIFIDKPDGLWNDEYVSYMISATPWKGFVNAVKSQCHMPLYYIYLKFFMAIFGQSDILLRLTSVIAGMLSIPVMYFAGKEKDENTGILCASLCAISAFLIYYSQEVRLYSLLFLISSACLLYTIRLIKNPNKKNLIICVLFNFLILITHTIGFVFVFFNLLFISKNLFKNYKKAVIVLWSTILAGTFIASPLVIKILTTQSFSQWWGHFSISKIGFLFTDYFSPVITNLTNAPDNFFYMPILAPFMLIPAIIAIFCIIKSVIKDKFNFGLLMIAIGVIAVLTVTSMTGKLVFITKYSIEIYPILIFLACSGLNLTENKIAKKSMLIIYTAISLGFILFFPYSAPKMHRAEGHKIATDLIKNTNLKDGDFILIEYYNKDRFEKYFDFSKYHVISINKGNFHEYMTECMTYADAYKNGKEVYKKLFLSDNNSYLHAKLQSEIFDRLGEGQSVVMVVLNSVSFYNPDEVKNIASNETLYKKTPLLFLVFSYLKKETFYDLSQFAVTRIENKGKWTVVKFTKLNK